MNEWMVKRTVWKSQLAGGRPTGYLQSAANRKGGLDHHITCPAP